MNKPLAVFWFRRDLRLRDNAGLVHALTSGLPVLPVFIFDTAILRHLEDHDDPRVTFIYKALEGLQQQLAVYGSTLLAYYDEPSAAFKKLIEKYRIEAVYTNQDYEPYARQRDGLVGKLLAENGIALHTFKDQVIFEKSEVVKDDGTPYGIYTPYYKRWMKTFTPAAVKPHESLPLASNFWKSAALPLPSLQKMGFTKNETQLNFGYPDKEIIERYDQTRDIPSLSGTTRLGIHLRFGTISIRRVVASAFRLNETFLKELVWREFFMQLLWHQPRLEKEACKIEYDRIEWRNNEEEFRLWCDGKTGYPIVDAGMRQLNATGFLHNRVRMVAASFLVKHLLVDWRWGEAYFARRLLDYDLSANNGNWQWVAGCGCDAAPYFRIFNPTAQAIRFDKKEVYIKQWVPEYGTPSYVNPMVDHKKATTRCLAAYKKALQRELV